MALVRHTVNIPKHFLTTTMQTPVLTERLSVDLLTPADRDFIQELVNTKGWLEFIGDRNVHSPEDATAYIERIMAMTNVTYMVVKCIADNSALGIVSFIKRTYLDHHDIGFAFLPKYTGHGYAFEAASAVMSAVKAEHPTVLATTLPHNMHSIRLLAKTGFHFQKEILQEGETLHVYSNSLA